MTLPARAPSLRRIRRGALVATVALLLLCGLGAAQASAVVIGFDNLGAPPQGGGGGLPVNTQYSDQGVTFNNPSAFDYSQGGEAIPGFTHSGNAAVEPCFAVEFCTVPVAATFTAAQRMVRVWVGFSAPLSAPLGVRLTAFSEGGTAVGTADATLPPNASPTPIQTPLTVDAAPPRITRLEVSVTTGGGFTNGLAVDDVEFSSAGPPPPCPASGPPTVNVLQPPGGLFVQNNEFLLQGSVDPKGAPITSAAVAAVSTTPRTAQVFPTLIDPDGGQFGPVRFNGLLGSGQNQVIVSATNCAGTGSSSPRAVTFSPIPPGTRFQQLGMIEVNQAVQDRSNSVPQIAASPNGTKRTFARVYLRTTAGFVSRVSGTLTAVRPDGSRPPGPLSVASLNEVNLSATSTVESARRFLSTSLNFELPPEWLGAGRLHLQLGELRVEGVQSTLPCDDCDNHFPGNSLPATVTFHAVPPLRIALISVPWRTSATATTTNFPRQLDFNMLSSWLARVYPSAEVQVTQLAMPVQNEQPGYVDDDGKVVREGFLCDELNADIGEFAGTMTTDPRTRFYGLVSDASNSFMRGCSGIGGRFGSGPSGPAPARFAWDTDGSYADWYGGHEIAHMYGRLHPGACGETNDDHQPAGGLVGGPLLDHQGFDAGSNALGLPMALYDWRDSWSDLMTYCDFQWISSYSYQGILGNLCRGDRPNCPDHQQLGRSRRAAPPTPRRQRRGPRLAVTGSLALRSGRLDLAPLSVRRGLRLTSRPRSSPYAIVLRGPQGRRLARYPFLPDEMSDPPTPRLATALVDEVVPFRPATRRILIIKGKRTLAAVAVSAHAPSVRLRSLTERKRLRRRVTLRWRSRDADDGRRHYTVLYSHDGRRYIPIAAGLRKTSLKVDLRRLPGGMRARFRVIATDGVRTGSARSAPLSVAAKAPRVLIETPGEGAQLAAGEATTFAATVTDLQDLRLPASRVVWRSSLQGEIGRGEAISAALSPGNHVITVRATNRAGKSATRRIAVSVAAPPPLYVANVGP